ncbi:M56 family metallopeptidase [Sphingomonas sp.]|uniref:M56 family metallopeptidase n=1 Tax=Sphingomonas sp. TaxID=28214 RepID=UPI003CC582BD
MSAVGLAGRALDALIASTLLLGAVLLARGPVRHAFGPRVSYALWALPALRLLLPPLPAGWWHSEAAAPITRAGETIVVYVAAPMRAASGPSVGLLVAAVWAAGVALFLGWHLLRHLRFCRAVVRGAAPIGQHGDIRVIASAAAPGPLAFGIWQRYVAFPRDFADRYDADERALALAHELGHHARRDLLANWAALAVLALHWFSPLAWRAFRAFRADQELANDARVLAGCAPDARHAYGRAIVKAAHGSAISAACHLHTVTDLKGRLKMLTTSQASRRRLATGAAAVTLLGAAGLGLTASSSAAERISTSLKTPIAAVAPAALVQAQPAAAAPPTPVDGARRTRRVVVVENGVTHSYEGAEADAYIAAHPAMTPPPQPATVGGPDGQARSRVVIRDDDGTTHRYEGAEADAYLRAHPAPMPPAAPDAVAPLPPLPPIPPIPEVSSANCRDAGPMVETSEHRGRQRIVICRNRVERQAREGAELAANADTIERQARASALAGVERARVSIEADRNLTAEQKREALAGLDEALAELRSDHN